MCACVHAESSMMPALSGEQPDPGGWAASLQPAGSLQPSPQPSLQQPFQPSPQPSLQPLKTLEPSFHTPPQPSPQPLDCTQPVPLPPLPSLHTLFPLAHPQYDAAPSVQGQADQGQQGHKQQGQPEQVQQGQEQSSCPSSGPTQPAPYPGQLLGSFRSTAGQLLAGADSAASEAGSRLGQLQCRLVSADSKGFGPNARSGSCAALGSPMRGFRMLHATFSQVDSTGEPCSPQALVQGVTRIGSMKGMHRHTSSTLQARAWELTRIGSMGGSLEPTASEPQRTEILGPTASTIDAEGYGAGRGGWVLGPTASAPQSDLGGGSSGGHLQGGAVQQHHPLDRFAPFSIPFPHCNAAPTDAAPANLAPAALTQNTDLLVGPVLSPHSPASDTLQASGHQAQPIHSVCGDATSPNMPQPGPSYPPDYDSSCLTAHPAPTHEHQLESGLGSPLAQAAALLAKNLPPLFLPVILQVRAGDLHLTLTCVSVMAQNHIRQAVLPTSMQSSHISLSQLSVCSHCHMHYNVTMIIVICS